MKRYLIAAVLSIFAGVTIAAEINDLDPVDSGNVARFPESMPLSDLNDGSRALEGILARYRIDSGGEILSAGTSLAYTVAASGTYTAYYDGMVVGFEVHTTNAGLTDTLNIDSVGAKTIKKHDSSGLIDLAAGDLPADAKIVVVYDLDNDVFQLIAGGIRGAGDLLASNNLSDVDSAATARANISAAASVVTTQGDIIIGDSGGSEAPLAIGNASEILTSNGTTLSWAATSTVIPTISVATTGTTLSLNPYADASATTQSHTLSRIPDNVVCHLINITTEHGWDSGDRLLLGGINAGTAGTGPAITVHIDETNVVLITAVNGREPEVLVRGTGSNAGITDASWRIECVPWLWN